MESKYVNFRFFEEENLLFVSILSNIGLTEMKRCQEEYSPRIIRAFDFNLTIEYNHLISSIKGTTIVIPLDKLSRALGLPPPKGPMFSEIHNSLASVDRYDKEAYRVVSGDDITPRLRV